MNPSLRRTLLLAVQIAAIGTSFSQAALARVKVNAKVKYTASELVDKINALEKGKVAFEVDWDRFENDAETFRVKAKIGNSKNAFPVLEEITFSQDLSDPTAPLRTLKSRLGALDASDAKRLAQAAQEFEADTKRLEASFQVKPSRMANGKINLNIQGCKDTGDTLFTTLSKMEIGFHSEFQAGSIHYKQGTLDTSIKNAGSKALWKALTETIGKCEDSDPQKAKLEAARTTLAEESAKTNDAIWTVPCNADVTRSKKLSLTAANCERALAALFDKFNCPLSYRNGVQCDARVDPILLCQIRPTDRCHPAVEEPSSEPLVCETGFIQRTMSFFKNKDTDIRFCQRNDSDSQMNSKLLEKKSKPPYKPRNTRETGATASGDAN